MLSLHRYLAENQDVRTIIEGLHVRLKEQLVAGLSGSARSVFISTLYKETGRPLLVVSHNLFQAQKMYDDLVSLLGPEDVFLYSVNEVIAAEMAVASPELKAQRLEIMNHWAQGGKGVVVCPVAGLRRLLPPPSLWKQYLFTFFVGQEFDVERCKQKFVQMGYKRVGTVSAPGEFSVRGGIIDIYPLTAELPYRIELFDTEIESIRTFTPDDQRSQGQIERIMIGPADEIILDGETRRRGIERIEAGLASSLETMKDEAAKQRMYEHIHAELEQLREGQEIEQQYKYMSLFYEKVASLLDYLPEDGVLLMDEMSRLQEAAERLDREEAEWYTSLLDGGKMIHGVPLSHSFSELLQKHRFQRVYLSLFLRHVPYAHPQNVVNITCKQMQNFHGQMALLQSEVERWEKANYAVVFLAPNAERVKKLQSLLQDYEIDALPLARDAALLHGKCQLLEGDLNTGFELPLQKIAVITEEELFKNGSNARCAGKSCPTPSGSKATPNCKSATTSSMSTMASGNI